MRLFDRHLRIALPLFAVLLYSQIAQSQCTDPPTVNPPANIILCSAQNLNVVFSGTPGANFEWTNSNPAIGVPVLGTGNININVVTVIMTQVATFTVRAFIDDCYGPPVSFTVTVNPGTTPPLPNYGTICRSAPPIPLPTMPGGVSGNWSGIGVVNNVFNPAVSSGDPIQLLFVPNPGQCAIPGTITISFFPELFFFVTGFPGPYCEAEGPIDLSGLIQPPGTPGSWGGAGITPGGIFDPGSVGGGFHDISFTTNEACPVTIFFGVEVEDANMPVFNALGPYCVGSTPGMLPAASVNGITGTWSPAVINTNAPGSATYTFTPNGGQGCVATATLQVVTLAPPVLICEQQNPVSTAGGNDGSAIVQISGGTPGYILTWSGAANGSQNEAAAGTATITGLVAGNYSLTVTDANGCQQTCSFTIGSPGCNILLDATGTNPACNGNTNGSILLEITNSTGTLTFDWNNNTLDGIQNPTGLAAGSYSVTVTDGAGCEATTSVTLSNPPVLGAICAQQNPVSTVGGSDGSATVQISGGTAGYTVAWSGAASGSQMQAMPGTATIMGLIAGMYTVTVTDANGCQQTCSFTINAPNCIISLSAAPTNPSCNGGNNGSITLSVSNATGLLNFDWNDDALDGIQNPTGLSAGMYSVTVTDAAGCTATATATLNNPPALVITNCAQLSPVVTVGGNEGVANVQIFGGTPGYTIVWSGAANGSQMQNIPGTATITGLIAGNYSVTVTDLGGCTQTCTFTIEDTDCNMMLSIAGTNPLCNGSADGSITLTVSNATGNVTFDWNADALDGIQNPTGLAAGVYSVTATDEAGCGRTASITLNNPPVLALTCMQQNPVSTVGGSNGSAIVQITGGTAGYTIAWSGPAGGSQMSATAGASSIIGLPAGNYSVTVTDNNGCEQTCTFTINGPNCALSLNIAGTDPTCAGDNNGSISLSANNAVGSLTFDWNVDALDGTQNPTGLAAGLYSVTVTDGTTGCTANASVTLTDPVALALVCAQQNPTTTVGGADGSATVQISGGTTGYTVAWSGAASGSQMQAMQGTATITGLVAGAYSVTVTDMNGCEATCNFTIGQPDCIITASIAGTDPLCNGSADGTITLTVNDGAGTLTFDWNDNALDGIENPAGLAAGTYSVTVTDAVNCQATATITLNNPSALNVVCAEENPVSTVGGNDGSATVQVSGGTPGYTLSWSGPLSGNTTLDNPGTTTLTGLESGDYTLTVTDANGCEQTCTFYIDKPLCDITIDIMGADPLCTGGMNGAIALLVNGATGSLNFDWSDNTLDGIQNPSGLGAGAYSVTVTDALNCDADATITLVNPPVVTLVCAQQNPVSAPGGSDGSATVQVSGGTPGYTVDWFGPVNGSQTQATPGTVTITGLATGNYMVFVTDANGCEQTCSFSIGDPGCNIILNISGTGPLCNGTADGAITLIVNNANGNLNFDWNVNALDGIQNPTGLSAGSYTVTVTDDASCEAVASVTLTNPPVLNITCAQQNPVSTIGGSDGSATVQISGGTAGYTIEWSGAASGSQNQAAAGMATITGLIAGNYSVTITDANGCEQTCNFIINSPDCNISLNINGTNPLCNGAATGSISLTVNNATGSLTFDWNDNTLDGIQNPSGLTAGAYSVTVTDGAGCAANTSVTLTDPALLAIVCTQQNPVSTIGGSDGSATVQISGGTAGYTIEWSGAASGSQNQAAAGTATITGLIAGNYMVVVTDANGCMQTCSFSIGSPNCNITLDLTGTDPLCNGGTDGELTLVVNGATSMLQFDWNDDALDGIQNPTGLGAGTYTVIVTDEENCTATATLMLGEPDAIALLCAEENPVSAIGANDGSATVAVSGGTAGYTIEWSGPVNGSTTLADPGTATITDLEAGTYTVLVTDDNGCEATCTFTITEPSNCNITLDLTGTDPLCNGGTDGELTLVVNGATGMLQFDWNDDALDGIQNPTGLGAGTYTVIVTDEENCTATATLTLGEPDAIALLCAEENPVSAIGANDGSATVAISGGTAGYTIEWSGPVSGSTTLADPGTATITDLEAGTYTVLVTDDNGCEATCTFTITEPSTCNITLDLTGTDPLCNGGTDGELTLVVNGATGMLQFDWNDDALDGIQSPTGLGAGTYTVIVTDEENCTATATLTLGEPDAIALLCAEENPVSAIGANDGSATVQISGGTAGYTIEWSGPVNGSATLDDPGTATITDLEAGTYTVLVTDDNGCEATCTFTITEPSNCNITLDLTGTDPLCNGGTDGELTLVVNGATGMLQFDWNDDAIDGIQNPTGLGAGTYTVIVTDEENCTATATLTLGEPDAIALLCAEENPVSAIGANDGLATVAISGGTAGYTIEWSGPVNGSGTLADPGTATITDLEAGTYAVLVTDENGCEATCTFTITEPSNCNITLDLTGTDPLCNGGTDGELTLVVNGATGMLQFDWNDDALDGIQNPTGLGAGTYTVIVTDEENCTATATLTLGEPDAIALLCAEENPVSAIGANDGSATVQISGGTAPYSVAWSGAASGSQNQPVAGTATITGLIAGNYNITVTDANGCTSTCTFTITEPTCNISLNISGTNPVCNGATNGSISLTVNNATGALTFDWNDNSLDGIQNPTGLGAGTYTVIVTDAAGCTATASVTLTDPAAVVLVCAQQNPVSTVGGSNGSATVQISGGTAPYSVAWSGAASGSQNQPVAGTATITDLEAGTYTVLVTDDNGCEATCTFTITEPSTCNITLDLTGTDPLCNGGTDGELTLVVNGATGILQFDWNDDALDGIQNPTGLTAGTYTVIVTDEENCTATATLTLGEPDAIALLCAEENPVSAIGANDGSATVAISGGTAGYTIEWSGPVSGSTTLADPGTATITGLIAGNYNITVTDANGCTSTCTFIITEPTCNISLNISGTNPVCNGATNGSISLTVNNATGALTFDWNDNSLDGIQNPTGLGAGTYTVIVTDAAGCTATATVTITEPAAISFVVTGVGADCFGTSGMVTIASVSGGTAPFAVSVNGMFQAELEAFPAVLNDFAPGSYSISIEDANGCRAQASVAVPLPQVYTLNLGPERSVRLGDSVLLEGMANFVIDSVVWTPDATLSDPRNPASFARPAATTTYTLIAFDANGCSAQATVRVLVDKDSRVFIPNAFSPNDDNINDVFMIFTDSGVVQVRSFRVFDRWGNMLYVNGPFPPNDPLYGWDGRFKGRLMNAGVYVYAAEVEYFDGRLETLSGEVNLMR